MGTPSLIGCLCLFGAASILMARAETIPARAEATVTKIALPSIPLGVVSFPNGKAINLSVGIATGAFHPEGAGEGLLWTVTGPGPFIACAAAKPLMGMSDTELCNGNASASIALLPSFAPTIYALEIGADRTAHVTETLPLRDRSGRPLPGLGADEADDTLGTFDVGGRAVEVDHPGVAPGALVRLRDGSFWVSESYGPSLLHVATDGRILSRVVPVGSEGDYDGVDYDVVPALPAILASTLANAAFNCLALSSDERSLYLAMRPPIRAVDQAASASTAAAPTATGSPFVRLLTFDLAKQAVTAQSVLELDAPQSFRGDFARAPRQQHEVRLAEIVALPGNRLLGIERIGRSTRLSVFTLDAGAVLPARYDDPSTDPAFETLGAVELRTAGMEPLRKTNIFDTDALGDGDQLKSLDRVESAARLSDRDLVLFTDNAFGIDGDRLRMFRLTFAEPVLR